MWADNSIILEHHSNLVHPREETEELNVQELLMEDWSAPVIITTLAQLLNTLLDGKTSSIRRVSGPFQQRNHSGRGADRARQNADAFLTWR